MRSYEDEQQINSVKFEGNDARKLIEMRKRDDAAYESVCRELKAAYELAETKFQELAIRSGEELKGIFKNTPLENVPPQHIGFDYEYADKHGIVFASELPRHPLSGIFEAIHEALSRRSPTKAEAPSGDDRIIVEPTGEARTTERV
jgi:hypothetical protein